MEAGFLNSKSLFQAALHTAQKADEAKPLEHVAPAASHRDDGPNFGETLGGTALKTIDTMRQTENLSAAMMTGKADPHSVVEALAATEMALESAVAIRNKVVEAYQEILRMPV